MDEETTLRLDNFQYNSGSRSDGGNTVEEGSTMRHAQEVDPAKARFPYSVVSTPIPLITWILPFIRHMAICTSQGVIRDFQWSYNVTEDKAVLGGPTMYWQLDIHSVGSDMWDRGISEATEVFKMKRHKCCCDNCYSFVTCALNKMNYKNSSSWNMFKLGFLMLRHGKYVSTCGFIRTWLPFCLTVGVILTVVLAVHFHGP